jgi:hypothetical protein
MSINSSRLIIILVLFFKVHCFSQTSPVLHWQKTYGSYGVDIANDVVELNDGGFIIVGTQGSSGYATRTNSNGVIIWEKTYVGSLLSCEKLTDGNVLVTVAGGWIYKIDLSGNIIFQKKIMYSAVIPYLASDGFKSIKNTTDGNIILTGVVYLGLPRFEDTWVVKIDNNGNVL